MINAATVMPLPDDDPIPLTETAPIPAFPVASLPTAIRAMVEAVAEATQTDPAMVGAVALSALSACNGGCAVIEVRPGWREPLNLYTATIANPGERKSAVQQTMTAPLLDVEHELVEATAATRLEQATMKQIAERTAEKLKDAAAKAPPAQRDKALADAIGAAQYAAEITVPAIPRLIADDTTPEAAGTLLAEQNGKLAIISAEGGIFDIIAGRYSGNVPNMDLWLKGHSGDPIKIDRKNRSPEYIRRPALTLGLMIQQAVLAAIANNPQFRGRGFLARILYAYPKSKVGRLEIAPPPADQSVIDAYNATLRTLVQGMLKWAENPAVLTMTPTAHKAIIAIEKVVEPSLGDGGELAPLADWGAKYVGAIARIAGNLHLAQHGPNAGIDTPVSAETIGAAWKIGDYFKHCAIKAFCDMGTDPQTAEAVYLLGRIEQLGEEELSERDIHRATKSKFKKKADLLPAIDRLVEHGYLIPAAPTGPTGCPPAAPRYRVHAHGTKGPKGPKA